MSGWMTVQYLQFCVSGLKFHYEKIVFESINFLCPSYVMWKSGRAKFFYNGS
jgi:hypothetical protein